MFFIISLNPRKNNAKIVGHATSLEQAIVLVARCADEYVKSKNEPVMHRGTEDVKFTERIIFFTRKRPEYEYEIDVFRQQTRQIKGWTGSSYKDEEILTRRFCYSEYSVIPEVPAPPPVVSTPTLLTDPVSDQMFRASKVTSLGLHLHNTIGSFPQAVLTSLQENERFRQSKISADANRLPPPFKQQTLSIPDDDDDISVDDIIPA
jgi:hypothetical protein